MRITVLRSGEETILRGRLSPSPRITERRGILFSGALFAPGGMRDGSILGLNHDIMVHSVERGSSANEAHLYYFDYLSHVNGVRIQNLEHLYHTLRNLVESESVQLDLIRAGLTEYEGQILALVRREVIATAPELLGAWPPDLMSNPLD